MRRLALVALLLTPALTACSQEGPGDAPAEPTPSASSATDATPAAMLIPEDFPLSDGMASAAYDDISISPQSVGMRALDFCGRKPLRGLALTDRLAAEASGSESANTRDLMIFAETGPPAAVLADIRAAAAACPADPTGPGSRLLTQVRESPFGSTATTVIHTYEQDGDVGIGAEIIEVVQVDRALLVTSTYAEWDPATNLDEGISEEAGKLEETVAAMSIFEETGPGAARAPTLGNTAHSREK
jgi:hypothetical protein